MRKENSELLTNFISEPGTYKKNRDYFAYVALDDICCWVLADGIDSNDNAMSAELAVSTVLNDFTENPKMSKKAIRRYLKNANQYLIQESSELKASIIVVVSNYSSILWASVGNARLYHFRKNLQILKTKDHSIAQLMHEVKKVDEKRLNSHSERNNLTSYLGMDRGMKISYGKKNYSIKDSDTLLLCSSGFWENLSNVDINESLKNATENEEFLENLYEKVINSKNPNLNNYTMASIFIKKAFKEKLKNNKLNWNWKKTVAAILIFIVFSMGFAGIRSLRKFNAKKYMRRENLVKIKKAIQNNMKKEELAAKRVEDQDYKSALLEYEEARDKYIELDKKEKVMELDEKISNIKKILEGIEMEKEADRFFDEKRYEKALELYNDTKLTFSYTNGYDSSGLEAKILEAKNELNTQGLYNDLRSTASHLEKEGDIYFETGNYTYAIVKYRRSYEIYSQIPEYDVSDLQVKIYESSTLQKGKEYFREGDLEYSRQNYKKAYGLYLKASKVFSGKSFTLKKDEAEDKMSKILAIEEAMRFEKEALEMMKESKYSIAKEKFETAKKLYQDIELSQKENEMQQKIEDIDGYVIKGKRGNEALQLEAEAEQLLESRDYESAKLRYLGAKEIYTEIGMNIKAENMGIKLKNIDLEKEYNEGKDLEMLGDGYYSKKDYEKALENYEMANKMYTKLSKIKDVIAVEDKINKTKDKNKKFLGIF